LKGINFFKILRSEEQQNTIRSVTSNNNPRPQKQSKTTDLKFYNGAFYDNIDGPGEGENDSDQADVLSGNRFLLHDKKECFQHSTQDCLREIRPDSSKTGLIQGTQNKMITIAMGLDGAKICIPYDNDRTRSYSMEPSGSKTSKSDELLRSCRKLVAKRLKLS